MRETLKLIQPAHRRERYLRQIKWGKKDAATNTRMSECDYDINVFVDVLRKTAKLDDEAYERRQKEGCPTKKWGSDRYSQPKGTVAKSEPTQYKKLSNPRGAGRKCFSCGRLNHTVADCKWVQPHQKEWTMTQWFNEVKSNGYPNAKEKLAPHVNRVMSYPMPPRGSDGKVYICDHTAKEPHVKVEGLYKFDSGSDHNVIGLRYAMKLREKLGSKFININPYNIVMANGSTGVCSERMKLDITIETVVGKTQLPRGMLFDIVPDQGPASEPLNTTLLLCDDVLRSMGVASTMERIEVKQRENLEKKKASTEVRQLRVVQPATETVEVHYGGMTDAEIDRFHAEIESDDEELLIDNSDMHRAYSIRIGSRASRSLNTNGIKRTIDTKKADALLGPQVRLECATPTLEREEIKQALEKRLAEARLKGLPKLQQ